MNAEFTTVFGVSDWNKTLLASLVFVVVGVLLAAVVVRGKLGKEPLARRQRRLLAVAAVVWTGVSVVWLAANVTRTRDYLRLLDTGQTQRVEGVVQVLHRQPAAGHSRGDVIRVGGREFVFSDFQGTIGYHRTLSHGGELRGGTYARLWCSGDEILKVEVRR